MGEPGGSNVEKRLKKGILSVKKDTKDLVKGTREGYGQEKETKREKRLQKGMNDRKRCQQGKGGKKKVTGGKYYGKGKAGRCLH